MMDTIEKRVITSEAIEDFRDHLAEKERSPVTIEKYTRDIRRFREYAGGREVTKELAVEYKHHLLDKGYAVRSINSMLAAVNSFFDFKGWRDLRVRNMKTQKTVYCAEEKELTKEEYLRLLGAAEDRPRLCMILQTICGTGIPIAEWSYFTVEAVRQGEVTVSCKNKSRNILIPEKLRSLLLDHCREEGIKTGAVFRTNTGRPVDRSNVWREMKALCEKTGVDPSKVFPHNLRKLFARTYYGQEKDIAGLADILGHSSIDTTRIYIMTTKREHRRKMDRLGLIT